MDSDLQKLESISEHPWLKSMVRKINIKDDCEASWNTETHLNHFNQKTYGQVTIQGTSLAVKLVSAACEQYWSRHSCDQKLSKSVTTAIDPLNFTLCQATTRVLDYRIEFGKLESRFEAVSALARALTKDVDLAIGSMNMQIVQLPLGKNIIFKSEGLTEGRVLGEPCITEARVCLSPEHRG